MFTTHGHQIPNTMVQERSPGHSVDRCGGVEHCQTCKDESDIVQAQMKPKRPSEDALGGVVVGPNTKFIRMIGESSLERIGPFVSPSTVVVETNPACAVISDGINLIRAYPGDYVVKDAEGVIHAVRPWLFPGPEFSPIKEDRPIMLSEGGFIEKARNLVWDQFYPQARLFEMGFGVKDVYVVWFTKTLQNWKAVLSTNVKDDMIYEVTYNGDKRESYVDAYKKVDNVRVPD